MMNMMGNMAGNMMQQGMQMGAQMGMYAPQGPGCMQGVAPSDPMTLQQRFMQFDTDRSGFITVQEIHNVYRQMNFTIQAAKLLLQAISEQPAVTMQTFPMFDYHLNCFWASFAQVSQGRQQIMPQQVLQGLQMLGFRFDPNVAQALVAKFDLDKRGVSFGEYMSICSYFLICEKLMIKFDQQKRGFINVDYNGLTSLGLWFM